MKTDLLWRQATGIGSLPFLEPDRAVDFVLQNFLRVPHWPQLPVRGGDEGFVRQVLTPLLNRGLVEERGKSLVFREDSSRWTKALLHFYQDYLPAKEQGNFDEWAYPRQAAEGFYAFIETLTRQDRTGLRAVKGQISGPVTVGFQLKDAAGGIAFYNPHCRELLAKTLELQMLWQIEKLQALGGPVLIFIDDPGIISYGQSSAVGLAQEMITEVLLPLIEAAHDKGALVGIHCCAGVDWSILLELPFDVINLDAYSFFTSLQVYHGRLEEFLLRGGTVAWGIVPTGAEVFAETPDSLAEKLLGYWNTLESKGVDPGRLRRQWMVTPACGMGTRTDDMAERAYKLAWLLAEKLNR